MEPLCSDLRARTRWTTDYSCLTKPMKTCTVSYGCGEPEPSVRRVVDRVEGSGPTLRRFSSRQLFSQMLIALKWCNSGSRTTVAIMKSPKIDPHST